MAEVKERKTSPALVALAWVLVGLPLGWGVYRSGLNAMKLFQAQPVSSAPTIAGPTAKP